MDIDMAKGIAWEGVFGDCLCRRRYSGYYQKRIKTIFARACVANDTVGAITDIFVVTTL